MSYTEQTWANGDIITAEKLNHMEAGIAAGGYDLVFEVNSTDPDVTFSTTISTLTIAEGSIAACVSMMENDRQIPKCAFRGIYGEAGNYFFTLDSDMSSFNIEYNAIYFKAYNGNVGYMIAIGYDDTTFAITNVTASDG